MTAGVWTEQDTTMRMVVYKPLSVAQPDESCAKGVSRGSHGSSHQALFVPQSCIEVNNINMLLHRCRNFRPPG
jgi:hypothetical protein